MFAASRHVVRASSFTAKPSIFAHANCTQRAPFINRTLLRGMASSGQKHEWMLVIPDKPGTLEKRMEVRGNHLENAKPLKDSGFLLLGGPHLEEPAQEGQPLKIKGSIMLVTAGSAEEAISTLKNDIYNTSGVWDLDNVRPTFRDGLSVQKHSWQRGVNFGLDLSKRKATTTLLSSLYEFNGWAVAK